MDPESLKQCCEFEAMSGTFLVGELVLKHLAPFEQMYYHGSTITISDLDNKHTFDCHHFFYNRFRYQDNMIQIGNSQIDAMNCKITFECSIFINKVN
jgi:hypothetical protein